MIVRVDAAGFRQYAAELVEVYRECFAEAPWYELFSAAEVQEWLNEMLGFKGNVSLVSRCNGGLATGALLAFPLSYKEDVRRLVADSVSGSEAIYIAEVFVDRRFRQRGIATALHNACLALAKQDGYRYVVERTNFDSRMFPIIRRAGFRTAATQLVASKKSIDGQEVVEEDARGIFLREL